MASSFCCASVRSLLSTMAYRSNMLRVFQPPSRMMVSSSMPARRSTRAPLRRRPWNVRPDWPMAFVAARQALRNSTIGFPLRWET